MKPLKLPRHSVVRPGEPVAGIGYQTIIRLGCDREAIVVCPATHTDAPSSRPASRHVAGLPQYLPHTTAPVCQYSLRHHETAALTLMAPGAIAPLSRSRWGRPPPVV